MPKKIFLVLGLLLAIVLIAVPHARQQKQVGVACCSPPPLCPGSPGCPK